MKKIVAIIVTYKRKELLEKVLMAIVKQTVPVSKIIVVDNNSNDGTSLLVSQFSSGYSNIEYFNTGANLGGAGGFRYGFEKALKQDFDYIWLMDDDFLPDSDCLENLLAESSYDIVQPMRFNMDNTCAELSPVKFDLEKLFSLSPKMQTVAQLLEKSTDLKSSIKIDGVPFEGPLISKRVVEKVGLPDSRFFIFYDDMDYSIRARECGFSIGCAFKAKAKRLLLNNQKNDISSWKGYFMLRNLFYLFFSHGKSFSSRNKPYILAVGFITLSIVKGDLKAAQVCLDAIRDARELKCDNKYIP
jgi:Predicted glycosyltransferases